MAAVDAAIVVQLVDHDVAQVLERLGPLGVVRQDARVQHVGIGEHHVGALADGAARVLRRVAVVGEGAKFGAHRVHAPSGIRAADPRPAPWWGTDTSRARSGSASSRSAPAGCSTASCRCAVGVTTTTLRPPAACSNASAWCVYSWPDAARDQRLLERRRQRFGKLGEYAGLGRLAADGAHGRIRVGHPFLEARDGSGKAGAPRQDAIVLLGQVVFGKSR